MDKIKCSICKKDISNGIFIEELKISICQKCICEAYELLNGNPFELKEKDTKKNNPINIGNKIYSPSEINKSLKEYIVGQDLALETISTAIYNHKKRVQYNNNKEKDIDIEKSNILLVGPTGCGKTLIAKTIAKLLDIPIAICDATSYTESGYVGEDVENCLRQLLQAANGDVKKAEHGIVYLDEIDKLTRKGRNPSISRDVGGEGVQQALLKIVEGNTIEVSPKGARKNPLEETVKINTDNVLFICGGSFEGIHEIIARRNKPLQNNIGFGAKIESKNFDKDFNNNIEKITTEDLIDFGIIPEFLGRFPVIVPLKKLSEKELIQILTEPKNAIVKQYKKLFELDNSELEIQNDALTYIAKQAIEKDIGARGLRSLLEKSLLKTMYKLPDTNAKKIIFDKNALIKNKPKYIRREKDIC